MYWCNIYMWKEWVNRVRWDKWMVPSCPERRGWVEWRKERGGYPGGNNSVAWCVSEVREDVDQLWSRRRKFCSGRSRCEHPPGYSTHHASPGSKPCSGLAKNPTQSSPSTLKWLEPNLYFLQVQTDRFHPPTPHHFPLFFQFRGTNYWFHRKDFDPYKAPLVQGRMGRRLNETALCQTRGKFNCHFPSSFELMTHPVNLYLLLS